MTNHGLKIAKPGFDAKTAGLNNLIFHSSYPLLKIKQQGRGLITYTNDTAGTEIVVALHNLGYQPLFRFMTQWYNIDLAQKEDTFRNAPFFDTLSSGAVNFVARPYVDDVGLRYKVSSFDGNGGTFALEFFYIIYYDPDDNI